ncbi:hypothetical protein [Nesterenkonia halotolerans]|uniref:Secreted protein n=1 Tax=Nesterenkonia halotolerans TaxID=225325 RepID=A0ABR9J4B9_9MICC|nr:hypothetical protein [Nesterenkonia halotolerans]MBE1513831.1 hypothetical protein [Nesterenkonia halotolerans]
MLTRTWMPLLSAAGAALLLSSCAADTPGAEAPAADASEAESAPSPSETTQAVAEASEEETAAAGGGADAGERRGGQQIMIGSGGVDFHYISPEEDDGAEVHHLYCDDDEALAEKSEHNNGEQPVGWPQEWDGTGAMPDPLCHPDYLEIGEWEYLEAFTARWEGPETSTLVRDGQSQEAIDSFLWDQSQARADWEPESGS